MKRKKTLKGITLMEVVVSIAVYGVIALLLAEIMGCVNNMMTFTHHLSERIGVEGKIADNQEKTPNTRTVTVSAHIDGEKIMLSDEIYEYSFSDTNAQTAMTDAESSVHFRYMNYDHNGVKPGAGGASSFELKLNMSRDLRNFKALPEYATKGVVGISKIEVSTVNNFLDNVPVDLLLDSSSNTVSTLTFLPDPDFESNIDNYIDGKENNLLKLNMNYDWLNDQVNVVIKFYPVFDSSYTLDDSAKDQPYATWNLDVHQHYKTTGVEEKWYEYESANYSFDGYNVNAVSGSNPKWIEAPTSPT